MAFWNWFGGSDRKMVGSDAENQRLDEQRSNITTSRAVSFGNNYSKKDVSYDYSLCYSYYNSVTSLFISVDKISRDCSKIKIVEKDSENEDEFNSIFDNTNKRVIRSAITNLLLTGNIFIRVFGKVNQKVIKLQVLDSRVIEFKDGNNSQAINDRFWVGDIKYIFDMINNVFIAEDELSYIYVIKNEDNHTNYGISFLNNLLVKMDWLIEYEIRNTNNMVTGVNAHKIIGVDGEVDRDDMDNFEAKYRNDGSRNGIMWTPFKIGAVVDISAPTDNLETYLKYEGSVHDAFHIPSPMLISSNQTFNNFAEAFEQYSEEAILPNMDLFVEGLSFILKIANPSFKGLDLKITKESLTLQKQKFEKMKLAQETQVLTINEVREVGGFVQLENGGDIVTDNSGIPIAFDSDFEDGN